MSYYVIYDNQQQSPSNLFTGRYTSKLTALSDVGKKLLDSYELNFENIDEQESYKFNPITHLATLETYKILMKEQDYSIHKI